MQLSEAQTFCLSYYFAFLTVPAPLLENINMLFIMVLQVCLYSFIYITMKFFVYDMSQPLWVLKTAKEKYVRRLVRMSVDLAKQVGLMLEDIHNGISGKVISQYIPSLYWLLFVIFPFLLLGFKLFPIRLFSGIFIKADQSLNKSKHKLKV